MEQNQINEVQEDRISIIDKFTGAVESQIQLLEKRLYKGVRSRQDAIMRRLKYIEENLNVLNKNIKALNGEIEINDIIKALEDSGYKVKKD